LGSTAICLLSSNGEGEFTAGNCTKSIKAEQYYPADKTIYTRYGAECGKVFSGTIYWYIDSYCSANDTNTCALINQEGKYPDFTVTESSATLNGFYKDKAINPGCRSDLRNAVK